MIRISKKGDAAIFLLTDLAQAEVRGDSGNGESGIGESGIGESGIGDSGIGESAGSFESSLLMSASELAERS